MERNGPRDRFYIHPNVVEIHMRRGTPLDPEVAKKLWMANQAIEKGEFNTQTAKEGTCPDDIRLLPPLPPLAEEPPEDLIA